VFNFSSSSLGRKTAMTRNRPESWSARGDDFPHFMTESVADGLHSSLSTASVTPIGHNPIVTDDHDLPYPTQDPFPAYESGYNSKPSSSTTLRTSTLRNTAWPENPGSSSTSPTPLPPDQHSLPSSTGANGQGTYPQDEVKSRHGPPIAIAAILPIAVLAIIGAVVFICMRRRRKQKQTAAAQVLVEEMKSKTPTTTQAYVASPLPPPRPLSRSTPVTNIGPATPASPQPVILGPILGSNNNYFTGIDTSDIMSVRSNGRTGLGDPSADSNSLQDEPPPPYYPRSIAPLSRDTSLRVPQPPPAASSQTELLGVQGQVRSPFDDPRDDDEVSDVSGPTSRRNRDDLSTVSDMSYQQDPVVGRRNV
jgi:hypothetical protein